MSICWSHTWLKVWGVWHPKPVSSSLEGTRPDSRGAPWGLPGHLGIMIYTQQHWNRLPCPPDSHEPSLGGEQRLV